MMPRHERRTNPELRRRVDELLSRVIAAREEIVESGLDAVHRAVAQTTSRRPAGDSRAHSAPAAAPVAAATVRPAQRTTRQGRDRAAPAVPPRGALARVPGGPQTMGM